MISRGKITTENEIIIYSHHSVMASFGDLANQETPPAPTTEEPKSEEKTVEVR